MYHATVMRSEDEDEGGGGGARRDSRLNGSSHSNNHDHARSPTQPDYPYSPSKATPSSSSSRPPFNNSYRPPSASSHVPPAAALSTSPRLTASVAYPQAELPPPPAPAPLARDRPTSNYYDPTSDSGERIGAAWSDAQAPAPPQPRETYQPSTPAQPSKYYNVSHTSPVAATFPPVSPITHSHPPAASASALSPTMAPLTSPHARTNGSAAYNAQQTPSASSPPPSRATNPMSFSSILADDTPAQQTPAPPSKTRKPARESKTPRAASSEPVVKDENASTLAVTPASTRVPSKRKANGEAKKSITKLKITTKFDEKEIEDISADIERDASPIEVEDFRGERTSYRLKSIKRRLELDKEETVKSKRRRTEFSEQSATKLGRHATAGENRYRAINKYEAISVVQEKEIQAEKERKKDMQRKRRREKTLQNNVENKETALAKAEAASDDAEREKFLREAQRAEKKAQQTQRILAGGHKSGTDIQASSPIEPNFSGGVNLTFTAADSDTPKNAKRVNSRPRKSKAQKQAEKDRAEASQAAIDAGEELPPAPAIKQEQKLKLKLNTKESSEAREEDSPAPPGERFASKGYNQIYEQIWRDLARKDVNKVHRLKLESTETRKSNLKKTAILASKEAKRWQARTNKGTKDLQARAKRVMREMMSFWKRNEREERDLRRAAERQEVENAKKAEADREANRQKRKLNFLISQTELYSHFIGKKIKTDEVERSTDQPGSAATPAGEDSGHKAPNVEMAAGAAPAKVTNFEDLDFDAEDDTALHAAAAANAQNAIQEAQDKARAFNKQEDTSAMDDQGEMNFQNPAGMGDVEIEQPKMLQAQLKEYQLKGLNWMVNLYEQGINGILADEMGLGKTVQSISVMSYLAEKHGIWGPFMVVAPASTLHNWQQEIAKFVPTLKVLPYWGTQADRKVLRKFWDRRHIAYTQDADFHVLITSYQVIVQDVAYFQKMWWQYMILDEAQAIKSSQSSRWKALLGLHCRNRLLLTGTPIQNNMQELWALLHFIMPTLFDSHEEFSEWFSKDIESHTQSNTKLNQDQLKRLHMILKPFMLRRVKAHVQKELGDKIEIDLFCDLTYRQRAYYSNLRNQISIMDLIEKATSKDDSDTGTLMNLVMQFRKVCNHPDLFERAMTTSPLSFGYYAETASFMREGPLINVGYSTRNEIQYNLPRLLWREGGRLDLPGQDNQKAGFKGKYLDGLLNVWSQQNVHEHTKNNDAFSFLRFSDVSVDEVSGAFRDDIFSRAVKLAQKPRNLGALSVVYDEAGEENFTPAHSMFRIADRKNRRPLAEVTNEGYLNKLMNVSKDVWTASGSARLEQCGRPAATAPPIEVVCLSRGAMIEREKTLFNVPIRRALYGPTPVEEKALLTSKVRPTFWPTSKLLPAPTSEKQRFTHIKVPSMRRFVTDSGKLAKLDQLLAELKEGGHRVLLYFQMTRMIDLMEEYLTYRNYKYCRLDGSTKLEDRRDTVADFQTRPEIFIFLLSTRAGGLGINLTSADTVIFYDSDWNPTIDSQAMDRAHRLGQTRQVTVYRMITRNTIEERIRRRAMQKEEVQKVVMTGGSGGGVDFNTRSKENKAKDIAMWLVDDEEAAEIDRREKEIAEQEAREGPEKKGRGKGKKRKLEAASGSLEDLYHEGEGHFDDGSNRPSGAATPIDADEAGSGPKSKKPKKGGGAKKAKSAKQRLAMVGSGEVE